MRIYHAIPRFFSVSICMLLLTAGMAPAGASAVHHARKTARKEQVSALEEQWRVASLNGDISALDHMLSDDYVGISWTGQMNTKAVQLDMMRSRSLLLTKLEVSDTKMKTVGSVAIVTALANVEGTSGGLDMKGLFRYTRVYRRLPSGTWQITNFEATRLLPAEAANVVTH